MYTAVASKLLVTLPELKVALPGSREQLMLLRQLSMKPKVQRDRRRKTILFDLSNWLFDLYAYEHV